MKINGEFILREIAEDTIVIPVGQTALKMNGMITLDPVAAVIWKGLAEEKDKEKILAEILERFEVEEGQALKDMEEFVEQVRKAGLLVE